ncbi:MAG: hypothetical protein LBD07_03055, partial [Spirochaetaceae bacterium]|nr:hypothetical protein [Spirochaetaceae bacterium]
AVFPTSALGRVEKPAPAAAKRAPRRAKSKEKAPPAVLAALFLFSNLTLQISMIYVIRLL